MAALHPAPARNDAGIAAALHDLGLAFGDRIQTGEAFRHQHAHTTTWLATEPPDAVFAPRCTAEVQMLVRICARHKVPVIGFGAGTSLEGHLNAPAGGISVDFADMADVVAVRPEDLDCTVQPGITRRQLNTYLRDTGLFFPIDPGADATLGGMAATRASGTCAVRYGTMRDAVISLEAVLPNGEIMRSARRARKTAAGYDLTRLMVGAEGTLGLITELTLRLHGQPEAVSAASCSFPTLEAAAKAVIATIQFGLPVARIEMLDPLAVRAVNGYAGLSLPETPLLLLEFHGSPAGVAEQAESFQDLARDAGATAFAWADTAEDRARLWRARHDAYFANQALRPGAVSVATDVCVPISQLAACISQTSARARALGLVAPIVSHAGDGNFHFQILVDPEDAGERATVEEFTGWLAEQAIAHDGSCTGEHGIGQGKTRYLAEELGAPALSAMRAIKRALDPDDIMNPGKIFTRGNDGPL